MRVIAIITSEYEVKKILLNLAKTGKSPPGILWGKKSKIACSDSCLKWRALTPAGSKTPINTAKVLFCNKSKEPSGRRRNALLAFNRLKKSIQLWITSLDALRRYEQKNLRLVFPTLMTLKKLTSYRTADQAIWAAKNEHPPSKEGGCYNDIEAWEPLSS